jgi:hypothetical protein
MSKRVLGQAGRLGKGKAMHIQAYTDPENFKMARFTDSLTRHIMLVRLPALRTPPPLPQPLQFLETGSKPVP